MFSAGLLTFIRLTGGPADWGRRFELLSEDDMIVPFSTKWFYQTHDRWSAYNLHFSCFWITLECSSWRATCAISPNSIGSDGTRRWPGLRGRGLVHSGPISHDYKNLFEYSVWIKPGGDEHVGLVSGVWSRDREIDVSVDRRFRGAGEGDIELSEKFILV